MIHIERWKTVLTVILCALACLYAAPNVIPMDRFLGSTAHALGLRPISLGLDLQGGSHLLLRVELDQVFAERYEDVEQNLRRDLRHAQIGYTRLKAAKDGVTLALRSADDQRAVQTVLRQIDPQLRLVNQGGETFRVALDDLALNETRKQTMEQSMEIVRRRVDDDGTKEPIIQRQGNDRIILQLPGVDDPARVKELLGRTARLSFHMPAQGGNLGGLTLPLQDAPGQTMTLDRRPVLTGDMLNGASPSQQDGMPVVSFRLNTTGGKRFCEVTTQNAGQPFAIVLDNIIISAPRINEPICGGSAIITGQFSFQEVSDLSLLLRAGALPAPLEVIEERTVGPSLGRDSIEAGAKSTIVAMIVVMIWMVLNYGLFGVFAGAALIVNMIILFAIMSGLGATLSLPGIAGIVLTIGVAVDANVLIFSRIREELAAGKPIVTAIDSGYKNAMSTIWDANMTTLIASVFLFMIGAGPVKGFAVTLIIGLIASMFSAIMVTRLMVVYWLRTTRPKTLDI
ncbi:MAG: protein translocase subunit SecD [Pseudomonadota bacterium]